MAKHMDFVEFTNLVSTSINAIMDKVAPITLGVLAFIVVLLYTEKRILKDGPGKGIYLGIFALLEAGVLVGIIYFLPAFVADFIGAETYTTTFRWILVYGITTVLWYSSTYETSGWRGVLFILSVLTTFLLGWAYQRWVGIMVISIPLFFISIYVTYRVAQIILPASDPESREEAWQKFRAFLVYLLGLQHPIWVAEAKAGRNYHKRIPGDTRRDIGKPGIVWTWSHQVAGISKGIEFNRVEGPGITFTKQYEAPVALVDLRKQLRVSVVDTVTRDGMQVPAVVFAAFAMDNENWSKAEYAKLRHATGKRFDIDRPEGSFPYSIGRVRSALGTSGVNNSLKSDEENPEFHWDDWVVKQIEHTTRQVVSERSLDELWRPQRDGLGVSALDEMADNLKSSLAPKLAEVGIRLFAIRIVNYDIKEDDKIFLQNIKTWSSYWEQRITEANADIEIIYREEIEKAHAYSKSVLLSAIAESVTKAREIHEDLPRHVIAQYFVHALEEYIKKQPGLDIAESKQRIESIKEFLMYNRTEGSE